MIRELDNELLETSLTALRADKEYELRLVLLLLKEDPKIYAELGLRLHGNLLFDLTRSEDGSKVRYAGSLSSGAEGQASLVDGGTSMHKYTLDEDGANFVFSTLSKMIGSIDPEFTELDRQY
ncbi:hypothetical protein KBD75_04405 [Candidatus Woesebacteria bacterium]|nr:hypothetical protein [Candidatus Woesebacteria bacterium]